MPLNTRQRVLLDFLDKEKKPIGRIKLMKLLFLFKQQGSSGVNSYDFVPYKYGPFSFEASHDIHYLLARFVVLQEKTVALRCNAFEEVHSNVSRLSLRDRQRTGEVWQRYASMSLDELINYVYTTYPSYTSNSLLEHTQRPPKKILGPKSVYTIGYEGVSIDAFFNRLLENGVEGILDVRRNAFSQKMTFCERGLRVVCARLDLNYHHIPELGIESRLRKDLTAPNAHDRLFADYEKQVALLEEPLQRASEILQMRPTSLLCFEATADRCHRGRLAPVLSNLTGLPVNHL